jgi:Spy/CpxP family protein refolding chaperone
LFRPRGRIEPIGGFGEASREAAGPSHFFVFPTNGRKDVAAGLGVRGAKSLSKEGANMSEKEQVPGAETKKSFWSRRWFWTAGGLLAGALALAAVAPRAWAFRGLAGHGFPAHALAGHGLAGHGRRAFVAQIMLDPAAAKEHVATVSDLVLRSVSATDEQKERTRQVTDRLVDQLGPLVEKHRELHAALVSELAKPQIDRAAIEKLRQDGLSLADQASRIAVDGIEAVADVLTPEQRRDLIDLGRRLHGEGPMH